LYSADERVICSCVFLRWLSQRHSGKMFSDNVKNLARWHNEIFSLI